MSFTAIFLMLLSGVLLVGISIGFCIGHAISTRYWRNSILSRRAAFALRR